MLKGEEPHFPLRIFITSRPIGDMKRLQDSLQTTAKIWSVDIDKKDILNDIRCYVKSRMESIALADAASVEALTAAILLKSHASFLWVRLVLDEMERVYTNASRMEILNTIPEGMKPYYDRAMGRIEANTREKHIAKAIFTWIVGSTRGLDVSEIGEALQHDILADVLQSAAAIEGLCGNLVSVGSSNLVELIHPTAREFLLSDAGEFTVSLPKAHERIALACLKLLCGSALRPPRTARSLHKERLTLSPLTKYAIMNFSDHICAAAFENDEILLEMDRFLKTNILSWIERVAMMGNHHNLLRACKNLRAYADGRAKYGSGMNNEVHNVDNWATDLNRIVTHFGEPLLKQPSSIYFLIPPMCPTNTAISRQSVKRVGGLALTGYRAPTWDDCIANISFQEDTAAVVSCGESVFAVGTECCIVNFYNQRSFQHEGSIRLAHPIDLVHLTDNFIVSCTTRAIVFQDMHGHIIWESRLRVRCIYLTASETHVIGILGHGHLIKWDRATGEIVEDTTLQYRNDDVGTMQNYIRSRVPQFAAISPDFEVMALSYCDGTVCMWDTVDAELLEWAKDDINRVASKLIFNPNPSIPLLLIIYSDHALSLYDTWSTELVQSHIPTSPAGFMSASCSPDGHTLATADTQGNMNIWDFETLSILYHIRTSYVPFRILSFTSDGSSILDVTDWTMRVWSPSVLVRNTLEQVTSISDDAAQLPMTQGEYGRDGPAKIVVLEVHPTLPIAVAGKNDGSLIVFLTKDGTVTEIYRHAKKVTDVVISGEGIIASCDVNNVLLVGRYTHRTGSFAPIERLNGTTMDSRVRQLCFSLDGTLLLVSTPQRDIVYRCRDGSRVGTWDFKSEDRKLWIWVAARESGTELEQFWLIADQKVKRYSAETFPSAIASSETRLCYEMMDGWSETKIVRATWSPKSQMLVMEFTIGQNINTSSVFFIFDTSTVNSAETSMDEFHDLLPRHSKHNRALLGWSSDGNDLIFINSDSWVCSLKLEELKDNVYHRHFYVPRQMCGDLAPMKAANDDIILCNNGEMTAVTNGMKVKYADEWQ